MLRERLEQGRGIPAKTDHNRVRQVKDALVQELGEHLGREYRWLAACTVAVEGGRWGGERRRKRRLKLAAMIGECYAHLGEPNPLAELPKDWEMTGLYYGYGAMQRYQEDRGGSIEGLVMIGLLDSGKLG